MKTRFKIFTLALPESVLSNAYS